jgi:hypothetical protein
LKMRGIARKRVPVFFILLCAVSVFLASAESHAFELKGFGDATFTQSTAVDDDKGYFALGMLDLYAVQPIGDRTDVLVELVVESDDTGEFVVDLERLQLGYILSDALKFRMGRFHNILGYWNTAYHHGAQLHTSIGRPAFLEFEDDGGVLPLHAVGLWASGILRTGPADVTYGVMLANGSKIIEDASDVHALDPNNIGDDSANKAVSWRLFVEPYAVKGLGLGFSGSYSSVDGYEADGEEDMEVMQTIVALDAVYMADALELLAEYYLIMDEDEFSGGGSYSSAAYYAQAGYAVGMGFTPYARYEDVSLDDGGDPYFAELGAVSSTRAVAGVRYDIGPTSALKVEARFIDEDGADDYSEYAFQWAASF